MSLLETMEDKFNNIDEALLLEDEIIVRYLKGKMTADEEENFIQELNFNEELKSKAVAIARMVKGMKEVGAERDKELANVFMATVKEDAISIAMHKGRGIEKNVVAACPAVATRSSWKIHAAWISAASVALLICGGVYIFNKGGVYIFNKYDNNDATYGLTEVSCSAEYSSEPLLIDSRLSELYENIDKGKDLEETINELSFYWNQATQEADKNYTDYAPEMGLNLAKGYLKINEKNKAKAVLKKLIDIAPKGTTIGDKARELLKKVDKS